MPLLGVTGGAAAVEFEPVGVDLESGGAGDVVEDALEAIAGELSDLAALGADDVVVVRRVVFLAELVDDGTVVEDDLADDVEIPQELHGAEDGGAADRGRGVLNILSGEVVAEVAHGVEHGAARSGEPVAAAGQRSFDGIRDRHGPMVPRVGPVCQRGRIRA